ncbi:acyl-CoA N-acyltransferase [Coemansia reversa NRRL 1564]|uniref:histone acetyltransferase n=1 Tax=Coemansia reversa (strain ATCC 12441 / NRRL 1564) TaxID=763665 RepID=A0A2G5BI82_COERN|nr:acyl-CoA N-acyltransferase [Coemansia reversa NRRL 1564]|eukprot:PIA18720.1 acyl-CoA N-acyltransferase [Coemansia reversa NRRL 1564]
MLTEQTHDKRPLESDACSSKTEEVSVKAKLQRTHEDPESNNEIRRIIIGNFSIAAWYASPYPDEYKLGHELYICERCLKYMRFRQTLETHCCQEPFPRGRLVYEDATSSLYEVDGKVHTLFCQNLCLLSKLFLDQKTVYYDIGCFLFYILVAKRRNPHPQTPTFYKITGSESPEYTFVGYFSKEKSSIEHNNLACILVLPPFRGQSYGQLLIELSYELTKLEGTTGGPEQPLSSQGFHSYRSYWRRAIVQALLGELPSMERYLLRTCGRNLHRNSKHKIEFTERIFSLSRLAQLTGIRIEDVLFTLNDLGFLGSWLGRHVICIADETVLQVIAERRINPRMRMDPSGLLVDEDDEMCSSSATESSTTSDTNELSNEDNENVESSSSSRS